jgi:membrane-associated phospholipid phosphatase
LFCSFSANSFKTVSPMKNRYPRLYCFLLSRLTPGEVFGLHLTIGVVITVAAGWLFREIADQVSGRRGLFALDEWLAHWLHVRATPASTEVLMFITNWHDTLGVLVMAALFLAVLAWRRAWYWALAVVATVPCGMLLNWLLKQVYQRQRPSFEEPLLSLMSYSFPSGHTIGATLLYGVVSAYLVGALHSRVARIAVVAFACLMVTLVALSRLALGAHYLSDVMAAVALGFTWLAICITAISTLRRHRAERRTP